MERSGYNLFTVSGLALDSDRTFQVWNLRANAGIPSCAYTPRTQARILPLKFFTKGNFSGDAKWWPGVPYPVWFPVRIAVPDIQNNDSLEAIRRRKMDYPFVCRILEIALIAPGILRAIHDGKELTVFSIAMLTRHELQVLKKKQQ